MCYMDVMSTITPDRVVELWSALPEEARRKIVEIAEENVAKDVPLDLSAEEELLLSRARDDFSHGRAIDSDQYSAKMSAFMRRLASQSAS